MKVFIMAVLIDSVYQYWELAWFYPGEALISGPVNRIARMKGKV